MGDLGINGLWFYFLHQLSALTTYPVPAKYREKILISVWVKKVSDSTIFEV
jgi:hypothetical protein